MSKEWNDGKHMEALERRMEKKLRKRKIERIRMDNELDRLLKEKEYINDLINATIEDINSTNEQEISRKEEHLRALKALCEIVDKNIEFLEEE